jgi:hypothetical protein
MTRRKLTPMFLVFRNFNSHLVACRLVPVTRRRPALARILARNVTNLRNLTGSFKLFADSSSRDMPRQVHRVVEQPQNFDVALVLARANAE